MSLKSNIKTSPVKSQFIPKTLFTFKYPILQPVESCVAFSTFLQSSYVYHILEFIISGTPSDDSPFCTVQNPLLQNLPTSTIIYVNVIQEILYKLWINKSFFDNAVCMLLYSRRNYQDRATKNVNSSCDCHVFLH